MLLHPDRYSTTGVLLRKLGVVVHDSEGGDGTSSTLLRLLQAPGNILIAGSNPPRFIGAGYHAITDGDGYRIVADDTAGPYSAPPLNKTWLHICMSGKAAQTRTEWLDALSRPQILGVARYIVDMGKLHGIPLHQVNSWQLLAGDRGYCGHVDVSTAWHDTDHTDPGVGFPWDVLAADIAALTPPEPTPTPDPEDDDMAKTLFIGVEGSSGQYTWTPGSKPQGLKDPVQRDLVLAALGIKPEDGVTVSRAQFDEWNA